MSNSKSNRLIAKAFFNEVEKTYYELISLAEQNQIQIDIKTFGTLGYWERLDILYRIEGQDDAPDFPTSSSLQDELEETDPQAEKERIDGFQTLEKLSLLERLISLSVHLYLSLLTGGYHEEENALIYKRLLIRLGIFYGGGFENKKPLFDHVEIGKKGAIKRHEKMNELKEWAIELYSQNEWKSANYAAEILKSEIMQQGEKIGARLIPNNAQRTISQWFRSAKSLKKIR
jgi:hypothetical protein